MVAFLHNISFGVSENHPLGIFIKIELDPAAIAANAGVAVLNIKIADSSNLLDRYINQDTLICPRQVTAVKAGTRKILNVRILDLRQKVGMIPLGSSEGVGRVFLTDGGINESIFLIFGCPLRDDNVNGTGRDTLCRNIYNLSGNGLPLISRLLRSCVFRSMDKGDCRKHMSGNSEFRDKTCSFHFLFLLLIVRIL